MVLPPMTSMTQATKPSSCNGTISVLYQLLQSRTYRVGNYKPKKVWESTGPRKLEGLENPCKTFTAVDKMSLGKWDNETCFFRDWRGF